MNKVVHSAPGLPDLTEEALKRAVTAAPPPPPRGRLILKPTKVETVEPERELVLNSIQPGDRNVVLSFNIGATLFPVRDAMGLTPAQARTLSQYLALAADIVEAGQ